ncbi:uncharacterized protein RHO17_020726 [Thomomys bottae]
MAASAGPGRSAAPPSLPPSPPAPRASVFSPVLPEPRLPDAERLPSSPPPLGDWRPLGPKGIGFPGPEPLSPPLPLPLDVSPRPRQPAFRSPRGPVQSSSALPSQPLPGAEHHARRQARKTPPQFCT